MACCAAEVDIKAHRCSPDADSGIANGTSTADSNRSVLHIKRAAVTTCKVEYQRTRAEFHHVIGADIKDRACNRQRSWRNVKRDISVVSPNIARQRVGTATKINCKDGRSHS